jgi:uncharacterized protein
MKPVRQRRATKSTGSWIERSGDWQPSVRSEPVGINHLADTRFRMWDALGQHQLLHCTIGGGTVNVPAFLAMLQGRICVEPSSKLVYEELRVHCSNVWISGVALTQVDAPDVASPCVGICKIEPSTGLCLGCLRTLEEIAGWSKASDGTKRAVVARIAERRGRLHPSLPQAMRAGAAR